MDARVVNFSTIIETRRPALSLLTHREDSPRYTSASLDSMWIQSPAARSAGRLCYALTPSEAGGLILDDGPLGPEG
ncbi:hypothetical protein KUCAC02_012486 [Chaenocephalus aceratus]|uniref:Uncharacterized protein n=1 Tax=Chaenocephalus aceratus TaxID=36190 RepID=A0ACB9XBV8_CHAAC|nr:hypothetical protein KUCAC02_012486 [Chaenocephalus aceratus]